MGDGLAVIIGQTIYDIMLPVHEDVVDFVNIIKLGDGDTVAQFKQIEPFSVRHVVVVGRNNIVVSADYSGIVKWNGKDKYAFDWQIKKDPPLYLCKGDDGTALAIAADGINATRFKTADGTILLKSALHAKAIGEPVLHAGRYYIPTEKGMLVLNQDLGQAALYSSEAITGKFELGFAKDHAYLIGRDFVIRLRAF